MGALCSCGDAAIEEIAIEETVNVDAFPALNEDLSSSMSTTSMQTRTPSMVSLNSATGTQAPWSPRMLHNLEEYCPGWRDRVR